MPPEESPRGTHLVIRHEDGVPVQPEADDPPAGVFRDDLVEGALFALLDRDDEGRGSKEGHEGDEDAPEGFLCEALQRAEGDREELERVEDEAQGEERQVEEDEVQPLREGRARATRDGDRVERCGRRSGGGGARRGRGGAHAGSWACCSLVTAQARQAGRGSKPEVGGACQ